MEKNKFISLGLFSLIAGLIVIGPPVASASIVLDVSGSTVFQQSFNSPCVIGDESCKQPTISVGNNFDYTAFSTAPDVTWNGSTTSPSVTTNTIGFYNVTSPVPFLSTGGKDSLFGKNTFLDDNGPYLVNTAIGASGANDTIPNVFKIGIDVNYTDNREQLVAFITWVSTNFNPATQTGTWAIDSNNSWQIGPSLLAKHNGNGFSDALLTGFNLTQGNWVFFEAIYGLQVDKRSDLTTGSDADGMEQFFIIPEGTPAVPEPATMLLLGTGLLGLAGIARKKFRK